MIDRFGAWFGLAWGAASAVLPALAQAEPAVSLIPDAAPPGDAGLLVGGPDARGAGILRLRLLLDHAQEPFVLVGPTGRAERVVERQAAAHALISYAMAHRVLAYAGLAVVLASRGEGYSSGALGAPDSGVAPGDLRVGARLRLLGPAGNGWQLGVGLEARPATGSRAAYASAGDWGARAVLAAGARLPEYVVALEAGGRLAPSGSFSGALPTRVGSALTFAALVQLPVDRARRFWVGPELSSALVVAGGASLFDPRSSVAHCLLSGRYRPFTLPVEFAAGLGPGLGRGPGSADYRVSMGVAWVPETPPPPPDRDRDSVPDATDVCVGLPGVPSNDPLMHGCPEVPLDTDGDSIPDGFDACFRQPGIPTAERRTHGCPKQAAPAPGAPPVPAAALVEEQIVISEQIPFETGTARLLPEAAAVLGAVSRVLRDNPNLTRLEVAGHTDDAGTPEFNLRLSAARARAVLESLVLQGIERTRLVARGYGKTRPIADNLSEIGKAKNRRVEFHVLHPSSEEGVAP